MASSPKAPVGDKYVLPTGKDDEARLDVIHLVYGPVSMTALEAAGIGEAARAADIGCGTGVVSRWMAGRMGATGRVDGIDISPEQVGVAGATAAAAGSGAVAYQVGNAYEPSLPEGAFDIVFCRLVLCHLKEPSRAVKAMARLLKPGGRLVLVDMDLQDIFAMPHNQSYADYVREVVIPYQTKIGVDYSVGLRLPDLMAEAGLKTSSVIAEQPIFRDGSGKHLWEKTWTAALQRAVPEGIITMERGMELLADMERHTASPDVWVAVAKMFAVVGRKPN
jgi:2-polyprenyl-3-methyl-5-hydroxy-6-metoxy-1,4-benzoquinol methylase